MITYLILTEGAIAYVGQVREEVFKRRKAVHEAKFKGILIVVDASFTELSVAFKARKTEPFEAFVAHPICFADLLIQSMPKAGPKKKDAQDKAKVHIRRAVFSNKDLPPNGHVLYTWDYDTWELSLYNYAFRDLDRVLSLNKSTALVPSGAERSEEEKE